MTKELQKYLGKSEKKHTMWKRFEMRPSACASDLAEDGFISERAAAEFLADLERMGIAERMTGKSVMGNQIVTMYQVREAANV